MKAFTNAMLLVLVFTALANCQNNNDKNMTNKNNYELATFGGGCFWCTEAIFDQVKGVVEATSGYAGGDKPNPTYDEVCSGSTGHAEVIQVKYNPDTISFIELLEIFFKTHDPTTPNRQGADRGTQYRSIVLNHNQEQKKQTHAIIEELNKAKIWDNPIVTEVVPLNKFYSAEKYHQEYFKNNKRQMYCQLVIVPKLEKFERIFSDKVKK